MVADLSAADESGYEHGLSEAELGLAEGGVPVGASLFRSGSVVATGRNRRVQDGDPIAHGEMDCIRRAGRQKTYRDTTLYTTLAPCMMCTGTIMQLKIPRVVVGEAETFEGYLHLLVEAGVEVLLLDDSRAVRLMQTFQEESPEVWAEDIAS
jgi:cytosine deaminase